VVVAVVVKGLHLAAQVVVVVAHGGKVPILILLLVQQFMYQLALKEQAELLRALWEQTVGLLG
jgi:hypothetical protein